MKKRIFAAMAAVGLVLGSCAFAQNGKPQGERRQMPTAEQMAQRKTDRMKEKLNLTEAQTKQVYAYNLEQIKEMEAQRERMRAARQAEAEKMKSILTPEQYAEWQQMQGMYGQHKRGAHHDKSCCGKTGAKNGKCCAKSKSNDK